MVRSYSVKTVIVFRHAGCGDAIQASCVLPYLKKDGYEITFCANRRVKEILSGNPHIDNWMHFEDDTIPYCELEEWYNKQAEPFDKSVVLTGVVENELLFGLGQPEWEWTNEARRAKVKNKNYFDAHVERAGYSGGRPNGELYFTRFEDRRAKKWRKKHKEKGRIIIGWALAGSAAHKVYRYTEEVIRAFSKIYPDAYFVFFGDYVCKLLTFEHANTNSKFIDSEPMFRESLLHTVHCDIVIGPETGILMGAGTKDHIHKILLASHSAPEQIMKYWENAEAILPPCKYCSPCHRLFKFAGTYQDVCEVVVEKSQDGDDVYVPQCCYHKPELVLAALERAYGKVKTKQ